MKLLIFFLIIIFTYGCNKTKTVLICGDHVCINKAEAELYFEENLSLEVQVIKANKSKNIDLVELNMKSNKQGKKEINIFKRNNTKQKIVKLSKNQVKKKKNELKIRKKNKSKVLYKTKEKNLTKLKKDKQKKRIKENKIKTIKKYNKSNKEIVDICTILEKCNIEEISKFLINKGEKQKFPDITIRE